VEGALLSKGSEPSPRPKQRGGNNQVVNLTLGNINVSQLSGLGSVYVTSSATKPSSTGLLASTSYERYAHVDYCRWG
jgi:hypothetical protein